MASHFLILFPRRTLVSPLTITLGLTGLYTLHSLHRHSPSRALLCDSGASSSFQGGLRQYTEDARVPIIKRNGRLNPRAVRQVSGGSLMGLVGGLVVSTFSRTLAFFFGLVLCGVQLAASRGYNIVPTTRLQQYIKGIDLRSAVEDNVAFKLSFGATFMLAAFAQLPQ